jgi:putative mRNA 3-end processing factor
MARRRPPPPTTEPVTWRDGVHVTGTSLWCDARRSRDVCFVSAADRIGKVGHGQLIATAATLAQLGALSHGYGHGAGAHLSVPYRRPFTLGTVRLELIPTGHALGAAALLVEDGGHRVLCTGVVGANGGLGELPELRTCDTLVVAAPYGRPEHRFGPRDEAADQAAAFARATTEAGAAAVLLVTSAAKGLDVAARLVADGIEPAAHRAIALASQRLRAANLPAPSVRKPAPRPGPLLWPLAERQRLDAVLGATPRRIALVSGRAIEPAAVRAAGADAAIVWSNTADRAELLAYIQGSGARRVYLTGPCADAVAAELGDRARVLGPPQQMPLFAAAAVP